VSWEQLQDIQREAAEMQQEDATAPPTACPLDGTPLDLGLNGVLGCPWCGWRSPE
jgi:hypothetical protein